MSTERPFYAPGDRVVGVSIAVGMAVVFGVCSHGRTLWFTFVPGVAFALALSLLVGRWRGNWDENAIGRWYAGALVLQVAHFGEEWLTGFPTAFPRAYGAAPFSEWLFVAFNLAAYVVFVLAGAAVFRRGSRRLLMPVLFFIAYGTWGNAVSHLAWCALSGGYFPGGVSAAVHAIVGPVLVWRVLGSRAIASAFLVVEAIVLVVAALVGFDPSA